MTIRVALVLTLFSMVWTHTVGADSDQKRPSLVVLLVFDQMRGDYLSRWEELFGEGGFRRLCKDGAWFADAHYPYAITMTAAGHTSLATGCSPSQHGIVGNDWWDATLGKRVAAIDNDRWIKRTWSSADQGMDNPPGSGGSPERIQAPTFADVLKAKYPQSRVVSLSVKERSAVAMGGQKADAVYYLDGGTGMFATSSYYGDKVHEWVRRVNETHPADRWFGKSWEKFRTDLDYEKYSGPDDVIGEGTGIGQGRTFPHPFSKDSPQPDAKYREAVAVSPMASELLVELAKEAIHAERLGQRETPDLLCISFSSNDLIGHNWGPDSQEVLDVTLRSDRDVWQLLDELDRTVGKENYVVALSADHGVCPLVEVLRGKGIDAGRLFAEDVIKAATVFLQDHYKPSKEVAWFAGAANTWIALNHQSIKAQNLDVEEVATTLARWTETQKGVSFARTQNELAHTSVEKTPFLEAIRLSSFPGRTGDLIVVPKEHYFFAFALTGTSHGTPFDYDTHVPVVIYGPGVESGKQGARVPPQVIAPVFCRLLGLSAPPTMSTPVPEGLFKEK